VAREPGAPDGRVRLRLAVTTRRFHARELEPAEAAQRWLTAVFRPALDRIRESVSPGRDFVQAYCDLLEHKWLLSESWDATSASSARSARIWQRARPLRKRLIRRRREFPRPLV